jgi:hypothetical protein
MRLQPLPESVRLLILVVMMIAILATWALLF